MTVLNGSIDALVAEKLCRHCGQTKPRSAFYADKHTRDGLTSWCIVCRNENSKANAKKRRLAQRQQKQQQPASIVAAAPHAVPTASPLLPLTPIIRAGDYDFNPAAVALYDRSQPGKVIVILQAQETRFEPVPGTTHKATVLHPITFVIEGDANIALRAALNGVAIPLSEDRAKDEQLYQEWDAADKRAAAAEARVATLESELAAIKAKVEALFK